MSDEPAANLPTFETVTRIISLLEPLSDVDREHVFRTVATWFKFGASSVIDAAALQRSSLPKDSPTSLPARGTSDEEKFSDRAVVTPKAFIFEKDPITEVERLACLAYYLTHFLETPHFKTIDLSRLNTEAAQRKLSNPAVAMGNAMRDGFFVHAPKDGCKQLSAMGERFVQLLPNREEAQKVKQRMSSRRGKRSSGGKASSRETDPETQDTDEV